MSGVSDRAGWTSEEGFTLLEMLVVLMIIGMVAAMSTALLRPPSDRLRLEALARKICSDLRLARAHAIGRNEDTDFLIDVDRKNYTSVVTGRQALPADVVIHLTFAETLRATATRSGFRFYPNGESSGGDLVLQLPTSTAHISVNWLSGEARIDR